MLCQFLIDSAYLLLPPRAAVDAQERMKARRDTLRKTTALHAEFYHRQKIAALKAEGERLREELRLKGVDPATVLVQADLENASQRPGNK
jgi:hypothetical protein